MENETRNDDDLWSGKCFKDDGVYYSLLVVVSFLTTYINLDVIFTMASNKMLQTKRNAFLLSLSVSDLMTGLVSIPLHIASNCLNQQLQTLILAQAICFRFLAISTMLNILMITIERYIGILYPIRYQVILTKTRMCILVTLSWATSISAALVSCSWLITVPAGNENVPMREAQFERAYFLFSFVTFFILPLFTMAILYAKMFRTISKAKSLESKARTYLKKFERSQSSTPRSHLEIRITRPRSVTVDSYLNRPSRSDYFQTLSQTPTSMRSSSHLAVHENLGSLPSSPHCCETQSPMLTTAQKDSSNKLSVPKHSRRFPKSPHLELPVNEASRYPKHHGSYDRFLNVKNKLKSTTWLTNSTQSIELTRSAEPIGKYRSDDVIINRRRKEHSSLADRLSDVCESAVTKLRMLRHGSSEDRWSTTKIKGEHRVLLVFVTMLSVFALSWISWYIVVLDFMYGVHIPSVVLDCFDILRFSVSFVNPILYTFFKNDFRCAFKRRLQKLFVPAKDAKYKQEPKEKLKC